MNKPEPLHKSIDTSGNETAAALKARGISPALLDRKLVLFARQLRDILVQTSESDSMAAAAREAHDILALSLAHNQPKRALACQAGCSHCCHNFVAVFAPQVFWIAEAVRKTGDFQARLVRIVEAENATRNVSLERRTLERQPCALLQDGKCSVYEHRPTACQGMASHDVKTCEVRLDGILAPPTFGLLRGLVDFGFMAALKNSGLPHHPVELNHALRIALETPDAEARWLAGEDIFAAVQVSQWRGDESLSSDAYVDALSRAIDGDEDAFLNFDLG